MARFILSSFADESASDLKNQLRISTKNDIKFIEMRNVNSNSLVDLDITEVKKIKVELDAQGFRLSAIGSPFSKISFLENSKTALLQAFFKFR
jgi:hypothetical protein